MEKCDFHFHSPDPDNQSVLRDLKYYTAKLETVPQEDRTLTLELPGEEQKKSHYEALCRGDIKRVRYQKMIDCGLTVDRKVAKNGFNRNKVYTKDISSAIVFRSPESTNF